LPAITAEWGLTRTAFAGALASGLVGMMLGGAAAGVIGDRVGRKAALIGSVVLFGLMTSAVSLVNGLPGLVALRFLAGLGLGGALPNATALATEYVPRRHRAIAVTLTIVCVPLGGTLAGLLAINLLPSWGWRSLFALAGAIPVAIALALVGALAESPRFLARHPAKWSALVRTLRRIGHPVPPHSSFVDPGEGSRQAASFSTLFRTEFRRDTIALWGAFFSCLLAVYLGFNWVPTLLADGGLSSTIASSGITAFNLGGVVGAIAGALAFARIGSRPTMLTMAGGAAIGALGLGAMTITAASSAAPIIAMLGITGGLINAVQTTMFALAAQVYPTDIRATGVGTAIAVGRSGAILSSYAGAWALEAGGSSLFFALVAAAMLTAFTALALVQRHIRPR
jgi:AAHS family 4-hydroxybenzoate transporter-like MFS transporter